MIENGLLNFIVVAQARVLPNILDANWCRCTPNNLKNPRYGVGNRRLKKHEIFEALGISHILSNDSLSMRNIREMGAAFTQNWPRMQFCELRGSVWCCWTTIRTSRITSQWRTSWNKNSGFLQVNRYLSGWRWDRILRSKEV